MPFTRIVLFRDADGSVPILEWLDEQIPKVRAKYLARLERLQELGHELRRPEADLLRDGIYELRVGMQGANYRMLYFFHGRNAVVVSHGLRKERVVPPSEIDLAIDRRRRFENSPNEHTHEEEVSDG